MLKITPEELLNIVGGRVSIRVSSMSIDMLSYDPGLTLTSNVTFLTFASLK